MATALRYIGTAAALIFIGVILVRHAADMPALDLASGRTWLALTGGYILYLLAQIVGAAAWRATLNIHDVALPRSRAESQLLVSQIGKYIPGNVAHLLGRFGLARADGVKTPVIASSLLLEVGFLMTSGVMIVGVLLLLVPDFISAITAGLNETGLNRSAPLVFLGLLVCIAIGQYLIWAKAGKPRLAPSKCVAPLLLHGFNFIILGVSLWCVAYAVFPEREAGLLHSTAIFTTAWVAGFLMPGAPGGVGVRDGIIVLGLGLFIGHGAALGAAVVHRLISVLGDISAFGLGLILRRNRYADTQNSV